MVKKILLNQLSIERNGIVNQRQNIRRGESNQYQNLSHIKLQKKRKKPFIKIYNLTHPMIYQKEIQNFEIQSYFEPS